MVRRVMVVDDEPYVVEGLLSLLARHFGDDVWILPCHHPEEAIQHAKTIRVDVLLTDIEMPKMDGLELHGAIRAMWPNVRAVFLTAHNNESYVRAAMRSDGVDYVLKAEDDSVLIAAVERALNLVDEQREIRDQIDAARRALRHFGDPIVTELFRSLLEGKAPADAAKMWEGLPIDIDASSPFFVVVAHIDDNAKSHPVRRDPYEALRVSTRTYLDAETLFQTVRLSSQRMLLLAQAKRFSDVEAFRFIYESLDLVQEACARTSGAMLSFAVSEQPTTIERAANVILRLDKMILEARLFSGGVILGEPPASNRQEEISPRSREAEDASDLVPPAIVTAERYIRAHLDNQLSVAAVAEVLRLNPSYLSRIYHRARGRTIQSFLLYVRTERARELLRDTELHTAEIANAVGLSTASYFAAFFKRQTGMTPQQYRERLSTVGDDPPASCSRLSDEKIH